MVRQLGLFFKLGAAPLVALGLIWGGLSWWTLGFKAFTTDEFVFQAAEPLPRLPPLLWFLDHQGRGFRLDQLRGRFYLLNIGFLACSVSCPLAVEAYQGLHQKLQEQKETSLTLLTLTVNPEQDSVKLLRLVWEGYGSPRQWLLASPQDIGLEAYWEQLKAMGAWVELDLQGQLRHTNRTFLINPQGLITQSFAEVPTWEVLQAALREEGL